jgi:hypothetical protein
MLWSNKRECVDRSVLNSVLLALLLYINKGQQNEELDTKFLQQ